MAHVVRPLEDHARLVLAAGGLAWLAFVGAAQGPLATAWVVLPWVAGVVAFLAWFSRAYTNLWRLGEASDLGWPPAWALWGWVIPGFNLALPSLLAAAVWRASHRRAGRAGGVGVALPSAVMALVGLGAVALTRGDRAAAVVLASAALALAAYYVVVVSTLQRVAWRRTFEERVRVAGASARGAHALV